MNLAGKHALVTGAGVRIGRAVAMELARAGASITIHYGTSSDAADETARLCEECGVRTHRMAADLRQPDAVRRLIQDASTHLGPVDLLVNSAALFLEGDALTTTDEDWESQFAINLRAPFLLSQAFASQRRDEPGGCIVNICDARTSRPGTDHFVYRLTKVALAEMTRMLALQLAPAIRVNAIALGAILPPPGAPQSHLDRIAEERVPLKISGNPAGVARWVRNLLEDDFLTGAVLPYDGGEFLA